MKLRVERKWFTGRSSMGQLLVDGAFELEDWCRPGDIDAVKISGADGHSRRPVRRHRGSVDEVQARSATPAEGPGIRGHPHPSREHGPRHGGVHPRRHGPHTRCAVESRKAFDALMARLQAALAAGQRVTIDVVGEPTAPQAP